MNPQVLDLKAYVSPKKKVPDGKLNQKVMAATVAKKENDWWEEIHCCRQQKDAARRLGSRLHEAWGKKIVRELQ
jgi:hypothetical protein